MRARIRICSTLLDRILALYLYRLHIHPTQSSYQPRMLYALQCSNFHVHVHDVDVDADRGRAQAVNEPQHAEVDQGPRHALRRLRHMQCSRPCQGVFLFYR